MHDFHQLYEYLGNDSTIALIALTNGFISGYAFTYSGFITLNAINNSMEPEWKIILISLLFGIMFAIIMKYLAVFVAGLLTKNLRSLFGLVMFASTIIFSITTFRNFAMCAMVNMQRK
jgi:hypothetical protein